MLLNEVLLVEGQDYGSMFSVGLRKMIYDHVPDVYDNPDDMIKQSKSVLKRKDRIIWYLKEMRLQWLSLLSNELEHLEGGSSPLDDPVGEAKVLREVLVNEFRRINTKWTLDTISDLPSDYGFDYEYEDIAFLLTSVEHFLSMGVPAIDDYVFKDQTPSELISKFDDLEQSNQSKLKRKPVVGNEEAEEFLRLNSNWVWFDLKTAGCREEGGAMGHCGNMHNVNDENKTILSLREKKGSKWLPHLTFIYHKAEKALGEMKGVSNSKPIKKLHKYIVPLLRDERIQILSGGGYKFLNNFKLSDLGNDLYTRLKEKKPMLAYNSKTDI